MTTVRDLEGNVSELVTEAEVDEKIAAGGAGLTDTSLADYTATGDIHIAGSAQDDPDWLDGDVHVTGGQGNADHNGGSAFLEGGNALNPDGRGSGDAHVVGGVGESGQTGGEIIVRGGGDQDGTGYIAFFTHGSGGNAGDVLKSTGDGLGTIWGPPAGGGNPLDGIALDGTIGDHFTEAALNARWTRRGFVGGAEQYQLGAKGTFMRAALAGRGNGDGWLQPATADGTYACKFIARNGPVGFSLALVDAAGSGVALQYYNASPNSFNLETLTTYSTYGGTYVEAGYNGAAPNVNLVTPDPTVAGRPIWLAVRKAGGSCFASYSLDGEIWSPESSALAWAGTMNRVGLLLGPLGDVDGANGQGFVDIDWFNKVA
jgi:hypothetical protein